MSGTMTKADDALIDRVLAALDGRGTATTHELVAWLDVDKVELERVLAYMRQPAGLLRYEVVPEGLRWRRTSGGIARSEVRKRPRF